MNISLKSSNHIQTVMNQNSLTVTFQIKFLVKQFRNINWPSFIVSHRSCITDGNLKNCKYVFFFVMNHVFQVIFRSLDIKSLEKF